MCMCEQLAQGCYLKAERSGVKPATFDSRVQRPTTIAPPDTHTTATRSLVATNFILLLTSAVDYRVENYVERLA